MTGKIPTTTLGHFWKGMQVRISLGVDQIWHFAKKLFAANHTNLLGAVKLCIFDRFEWFRKFWKAFSWLRNFIFRFGSIQWFVSYQKLETVAYYRYFVSWFRNIPVVFPRSKSHPKVQFSNVFRVMVDSAKSDADLRFKHSYILENLQSNSNPNLMNQELQNYEN